MKKRFSFFATVFFLASLPVLPSVHAQADLDQQTRRASVPAMRNPADEQAGVAGRFNELKNTAYGKGALRANTTGFYNTAMGYWALRANTAGSSNAALGAEALRLNTTGFNNSAFGAVALNFNTTGEGNTALGAGTLRVNTTGSYNVAVGVAALEYNTNGIANVAVGSQALEFNTTGLFNTANGDLSLWLNTTGVQNSGFGANTLLSNTEGNNNTATGANALIENTTGSWNTANGVSALRTNSEGTSNTAMGLSALRLNTTGSYNTAAGDSALLGNITGSFNTGLGVRSGLLANGSNNTFVGSYSDADGDHTNATAIGFEAVATASNQVQIGNTEVTSIGGMVNWTSFSDGRYKKDLKEDVPGMAFISQLRPVTYTLDRKGIERTKGAATGMQPMPAAGKQEAHSSKTTMRYTGFVAQDVEKAARQLNYTFSGVDAPGSENGFYGLRYSEFIVPLVKAVQELAAENKALHEEVKNLKEAMQNQINELNAAVARQANGQPATITNEKASGAYLEQNIPNPLNGTTTLHYFLPQHISNAQVMITNSQGQVLKQLKISSSGHGQLTFNAGTLPAGNYTYSLWIGGKQADTKQMVIVK